MLLRLPRDEREILPLLGSEILIKQTRSISTNCSSPLNASTEARSLEKMEDDQQ